MAGTVFTLQKCPSCGKKFPSSKGAFPIICATCRTQPTKFILKLWWQKKNLSISRDREGKTIHSWNHAINLLGNIRTEIHAKTFDPEIYKKQSSTSFKIFWVRFKKDYEGNMATHAKIHAIGEHHLDAFMALQMRDIRAIHIDDWWKKLKRKKLSPHYMNDIQQWLKRFFNEAKELDIIEKVPRFPKAMKQAKKEIKWLSEYEQSCVFEQIPKSDRDIFEFMFLTGVRVGEAIALQRSDINFKKGRTIIRHTVKRDRHTVGKTKAQNIRVVPHIEEIERCLRKAVKVTGLNNLVFINKWGRIYTNDYLNSTFKKACQAAGVEPVHLKNGTRHSFGMRMISSGVDIWTTSKAMGHSDIKMTENYADILADQLKDAYEKTRKKHVRLKAYKE